MTSPAKNIILAIALVGLFVLVVTLYRQSPDEVPPSVNDSNVEYPFSFTDDVGRKITVEEAPTRIVSLDPSLTEILFHLGIGERVMGVDDLSNHPAGADAVASVGSGVSPDLAAMGNAVPQIVLATVEPFEPELILAHAALVVLNMGSLEDMYRSMGLVGRISGISADADSAISSMRARQTSLARRIAGKELVSVYVELGPNSRGDGTNLEFLVEVLELAGSTMVLPGSGVAYEPERVGVIEAIDPDFLLILDPLLNAEQVVNRPGWGDFIDSTEARLVTSNDIDVDIILRPGPRSLEGVERLIEYFHPKGKGIPQ